MKSLPKRLHQLAQPIFTVEVYIVYKNKLLMFKRSETKKKFPGWWSLPGGHIDEGEDALAAAIRELKEETGLFVSPKKIKLKSVAMHHHLDREEMYVAFGFLAHVNEEPKLSPPNEEGSSHLISIEEAKKMDKVFPPIKYYFEHVLSNRSGIIYNNSIWENSQLVKVLSETVDKNS